MTTTAVRVSVLCLCLLAAGAASAEVEVSVTLTGDFDEIMAILAELRGMGVVGDTSDDGPLKLRVHSMTVGAIEDAVGVEDDGGETEAPADTPTQEPAEPAGPSLTNVKASPPELQPGDTVAVSVKVEDPNHEIDTIAVEIGLPEPIVRDLQDSGGQGDEVAGDGVWTRLVSIRPSSATGEHTLTVTAYDVNGDPVTLDSGEPLQATGSLNIVP